MVTNNDNNYKYLGMNTYLNLKLILWGHKSTEK